MNVRTRSTLTALLGLAVLLAVGQVGGRPRRNRPFGKLGAVGCRLLGRSTPINADDSHSDTGPCRRRGAVFLLTSLGPSVRKNRLRKWGIAYGYSTGGWGGAY
jgi:hypothetical protein